MRGQRRRRTRATPYVRPLDELPLREVWRQVVAKTHQLNALDDEIGRKLRAIEHAIRSRQTIGHPVDVPFPPWGRLGWRLERPT